MESEPQPFKKKTPVVEVEIGSLALRFTFNNTYLIQFWNFYGEQDEVHDFSHMNHIKYRDEDEDVQLIYDSEELFEQLDELGFTKIRYPYPTDQHIEGYSDYLIADLNGEVERGDES